MSGEFLGGVTTVLVTGDLHLSDSERDAYRWAATEMLRELIRSREVGTLIILGDLCHEKDHHGSKLVNAVVEELHRFSELCKVIVLRGNHDASDISHPFFRFTRLLPNVSFISVPTGITVEPMGRCLFLPWAASPDEWNDIRFDDYDAIFCHQTFSGARTSNGFALPGFDVGIFPTDICVVSGDVHVPQQVGPVTYVGAPYPIDFGDSYEPRVLQFGSTFAKSIKLPGPRKVVIDIATIEDWKAAKVKPGDIVKVRVHSADAARFGELRHAIRQWGEEVGVNVWQVTTAAPMGTTMARVMPRPDLLTDADMLRRYARARQVDDDTLDVGLAIVNTVV